MDITANNRTNLCLETHTAKFYITKMPNYLG
nr:MAG TPA: hypothetical protein [Caudoviricetes sp.]